VEPESSGLATEKMDLIVGNLLRAGVVLSGTIVFIGGLVYLFRHGTQAPAYHVFHGEPSDLRGVPGILQDACALSGRGIIQFGLLLLIATPVARVAYLIYAFALQKDRVYAMVALTVLLLLAYGLLGARV
jgi:uncharacterized membrane protein